MENSARVSRWRSVASVPTRIDVVAQLSRWRTSGQPGRGVASMGTPAQAHSEITPAPGFATTRSTLEMSSRKLHPTVPIETALDDGSHKSGTKATTPEPSESRKAGLSGVSSPNAKSIQRARADRPSA